MDAERAGRARGLGFRIGLALKGIDGLVELLTGLLLWLAPEVLRSLAATVANTPDNDSAADRLVEHWAGRLASDLASGAHVAVIVFLLSHGIVKLALVYCLLRDYRWVYRPALLILGLFALYQLVVLLEAPTLGTGLLFLLDAVIIWLVWREWRSKTR
ncbi:DUF2127 domain-containing protein [Microterricola pindariensis]|uniref:DUF2127 domain-containing protein n=1 Tax=Microterricola pindariensis TaxID=478010 RepID=A0ABX5AWD6_9MICO|nr:DUF2127 domain-containing protein [Microterricola pindariensis]PPL18743.1 hypothetical protein GY24_09525 [Microterricola pindariensis]